MSSKKEKWAEGKPGIAIYTLLAVWFLGIVVATSVAHLMLGEAVYDTAGNIRISNAIGSLFMFLMPVAVYSALFTDKKGEYLIEYSTNIKVVLLAILAMLCAQPFVETINYLNELITLPESFASTQAILDEAKEANEKTLKLLFSDKSVSSLLINILVVAILPGIVEELFFRGCLQRSILQAVKNPHVAVWITAIVFSLLHFQLSGFFPRILLGALLGYLYIWTKNIWIPILAHIINNASVVLIYQVLSETEFYKSIQITDYSPSNTGFLALISLTVTIALLYLVYRMKPIQKAIDKEENQ